MKIAFVITGLKGGGAEKAILRTAKELSLKNVHVEIIAFTPVIEHAVDSSLNISFLTKRHFGGFLGGYCLAFLLRCLIKQKGPFDLIISTLQRSDAICHLAKLPNCWYRIANTFSKEIECIHKTNPRRAKRREKRYQSIYTNAKLITVSEGVAKEMRQLYSDTVQIIYNPIDKSILEALSKEGALLPKEPYLIHVGRFCPPKRHDLLFEALILSKIKMPLVLLTQPSTELHALIEKYHLQNQVIVANFQKNPYPWIKQAALLVHPSDYEGMPNVLIEALLLQTPVVVTDCPNEPREVMLGDLKPFLVPCNDARALAKVMVLALSHYPPIPEDIAPQFHPDRLLRDYQQLVSM